MPEQELQNNLEKLQNGDQNALRAIFDAYYVDLCRKVLSYCHDEPSAREVVQQVFIKLWQKRNDIRINSSPLAYLHRMAINEALARIRRNRNFEDLDSIDVQQTGENNTVEHRLYQQDLKLSVNAAINLLPPKCKMIFLLSRKEEMSYREIASILDISIKTVENQMGKALGILREKLGRDKGLAG